jgi:hypothetical protein
VLAADCSQWAAELKALTPTVVFQVHDPGGRRIDAFRATVNGTSLGEALGDTPVPVDPGDHLFRLEATGFAAAEVHATLNEGEHGRVVSMTLVPLVPAASVAGSPPSGADGDGAPSHTVAYVFLGVGAVALATGGGLGIAGLVDKSNLQSSCAPKCNPDSVDTIRTLWTVGAVTAAAGAVSAGVGAVLWVRSARRTQTGLRTETTRWWAPVVGMGTLGVVGAF